MIKIGVSACFFYPDLERTVFGPKSLSYIENDMARYLQRQGVMPILIPDLEGEQMQDFLAEMDGFVFTGGSDMAPESYGEKPIGKWKGDRYRDEYELALMDYAMQKEKPVLGICRGFQVMNVYFGGTLYQDLATQKPGALKHRDAIEYDKVKHEVSFPENSLLRAMYGAEKGMVNSVHHQAVKELGKKLEVLAISPEDEIIEAFMWKGSAPGKVMGVQWHPEFFHTIENELINAEMVYDKFLSFIEA